VVRRRDGGNSTAAELVFSYDRAGRLEQATAAGALVKRFTCDEAAGGSWAGGKVTTAESWNTYPTATGVPTPAISSIEVTEKFVSEGRGGSVSSKSTTLELDGVSQGTIAQSFTRDVLGGVGDLGYPSWSAVPGRRSGR
jgi:hypothetical protein